ncbi:MAG: hypothetical protein GX605_07890 [Chloroflexi bacterium]|nr:hypothetical protein [Chloroflexota bacterium]
MSRLCGLRQLPMVYRLRDQGTPLHVRQAVFGLGAALWPALAGSLSGPHLGEAIYVLEGNDSDDGFLQVRRRGQRPEIDLVYIAPRLGSSPALEATWEQLLSGACLALGAQGMTKVYAGLPEIGDEVAIFRKAGFALYTREDLFCLEAGAAIPPPAAGALPLTERTSLHEWGIQHLYNELVPWLVQQAEGGLWPNGVREAPFLAESGGEFVILDDGEVVGVLRLKPGPKAHWLDLLLHPQAHHRAGAAIAHGAAQLQRSLDRPVYCAARDYQGGLQGPLEAHGFRRVGSQALLVRQLAAYVRVERPLPVHREGQPEAVVSTVLRSEP